MKRILIGLFLFATTQVSSAQGVPDRPYLAVSGHAETRVVPNIFPMDITLTETSTDTAASQQLIEVLAKQILDAAQKLEIPDADLDIGNLRVSPQTRWDDDTEKQVFIGNTYERRIGIRLRKLDDLRTLVGKLPASRNIRIQTRSFEHSNARSIRREMFENAVKDAQRSAQELAELMGKPLKALYSASDRPQGVLQYMDYNRNIAANSSASNVLSSEMIVNQGEIEISVDAYLVYLIGD